MTNFSKSLTMVAVFNAAFVDAGKECCNDKPTQGLRDNDELEISTFDWKQPNQTPSDIDDEQSQTSLPTPKYDSDSDSDLNKSVSSIHLPVDTPVSDIQNIHRGVEVDEAGSRTENYERDSRKWQYYVTLESVLREKLVKLQKNNTNNDSSSTKISLLKKLLEAVKEKADAHGNLNDANEQDRRSRGDQEKSLKIRATVGELGFGDTGATWRATKEQSPGFEDKFKAEARKLVQYVLDEDNLKLLLKKNMFTQKHYVGDNKGGLGLERQGHLLEQLTTIAAEKAKAYGNYFLGDNNPNLKDIRDDFGKSMKYQEFRGVVNP